MKSTSPPRVKRLRMILAFLGTVFFAWSGAAALADGGGSAPGSNLPGATSGAPADTQLDANQGTAVGVRQNYMKRFPYAKAAAASDVLVPVQGAGGGGQSQGGQGGSRLLRSAGKFGKGNEQPQAQVAAYQPVIKFCNDDPEDGICYMQPLLMATDKPATYRDLELFQTAMQGTVGMPLSDTQFQILDRENKQRFIELLFDPERFMWMATNTSQLQGAGAANSFAGVAENTFGSAFDRIMQGDGTGSGGGGGGSGGGGGASGGALINIANENAGVRASAGSTTRTIPQAVWMVQKMYHYVFVPIAILLLLPGAVITQTKSFVAQGFGLAGDDSTSPFEGILRATIAVFLIPATQLIVSYCIDIGNSLALSVQPWIDRSAIMQWVDQQTYNTMPGMEENVVQMHAGGTTTNGTPIQSQRGQNAAPGTAVAPKFAFNLDLFGNGGAGSVANSALNGFLNSTIGGAINGILDLFGSGPSGEGRQGKAENMYKQQVVPERVAWLSQTVQLAYNVALYTMSFAIIVLTAFQIVFMCYLFLLGPIAAAFFAWPSGVGRSLFRTVFGSWLTGVITLSLWRFYWCVILAIMAQRAGSVSANVEFEMMVFTCFLGLMLYAPFSPFVFSPGQAVARVLETGGQAASGISQGLQQGAAAAGMPAAQQQQLAQALQPLSQAGQQAMQTGMAMEGNVMAQQGAYMGMPTPALGQSGGQSGGAPAGAGQPGGSAAAPSSAGAAPSSPPPSSVPAAGGSPHVAAAGSAQNLYSGPTASEASNPAVAAAQAQLPPGTHVDSIPPGGPVMNQLSPPGGYSAGGQQPSYLMNTTDPRLAQAAISSIQQVVQQVPGGGAPPASPPPGGAPPSGTPPASPPPGGTPPPGTDGGGSGEMPPPPPVIM